MSSWYWKRMTILLNVFAVISLFSQVMEFIEIRFDKAQHFGLSVISLLV